jgi:Icc-related predicted phosphoesterase
VVLALTACASAPPPRAPSTTEVEVAPADARDTDRNTDESENADASPPATWDAALARYASTCPAPFFSLAQPDTVTVGGVAFTRAGSTMALATARAAGPLKIGVLGAVKDADPETRENVKKAAAAFQRAGVQLVVANGDLVGNETGELVPVVKMLSDEIAIPVFAHAGNYEWTSAFTEALAAADAHVVNMNIVRHVDLGGVHLLSLPGYFNRRFIHSGGCHYSHDDVVALTAYAKALTAKGDIVVLTSHGPPLGAGKTGLDVTNDGANVGDPDINALVDQAGVTVGLYSHILESGGRASEDPAGAAPLKLPMKAPVKRLSLNAGAATSFGWGMVDGKTSRGMAAIVTIDMTAGGTARVEMIPLR